MGNSILGARSIRNQQQKSPEACPSIPPTPPQAPPPHPTTHTGSAVAHDLGLSGVFKEGERKLQVPAVHFNMQTTELATGKHLCVMKMLRG